MEDGEVAGEGFWFGGGVIVRVGDVTKGEGMDGRGSGI